MDVSVQMLYGSTTCPLNGVLLLIHPIPNCVIELIAPTAIERPLASVPLIDPVNCVLVLMAEGSYWFALRYHV